MNMAGGQPVSMDNMKEVYAYCSQPRHSGVLRRDTVRRERLHDPGAGSALPGDVHVRDILREMMIYGDGCTVSGKKDFLINIGGVLCFRDNASGPRRPEERLRIYEGNVTDGGLATADLAAIARGVEEMLDDRYIRSRVQQTQFLGQLLLDAGVPDRDAAGEPRDLPRRASASCRTWTRTSSRPSGWRRRSTSRAGVRAMERGNVSKGRDPTTGKNYRPALELVRLTIPRRVYTNDHMRAVAEGIIRLWKRRSRDPGPAVRLRADEAPLLPGPVRVALTEPIGISEAAEHRSNRTFCAPFRAS